MTCHSVPGPPHPINSFLRPFSSSARFVANASAGAGAAGATPFTISIKSRPEPCGLGPFVIAHSVAVAELSARSAFSHSTSLGEAQFKPGILGKGRVVGPKLGLENYGRRSNDGVRQAKPMRLAKGDRFSLHIRRQFDDVDPSKEVIDASLHP